jgi:glutamyl-tRNA synthetase/glutamyl-Q tRNA(Asp) synthetase
MPEREPTFVDALHGAQHQRESGDFVVKRADGVFAYQLVVVVDDASDGVTRVVRGRDIATSTATQVLLHELLELPVPTYRHHFLLLEPHGDKLAKLHGSVDVSQLRTRYDGASLCGLLACVAGLQSDAAPCTPEALLADFDWARVRTDDVVMEWTGEQLLVRPTA